MHDNSFQDLVIEELQAIKLRQDGLRGSFDTKLDNLRKDFTDFQLKVVEDHGFQRGKAYRIAGIVSVVSSILVSILYKILF